MRGLVVAITGNFEHSRPAVEEAIKAQGCSFSGTVHKRVDFLFCDEAALQKGWAAAGARLEGVGVEPHMELPERVVRAQSGWTHVSGKACDETEGWWWIRGVKDEYRAACRMWWRCGGVSAFDRRMRERGREQR